jgi:hypothetical protein
MNAAIRLIQREIEFQREHLAALPNREAAEAAQQALVELGDALDLLRGAVAP